MCSSSTASDVTAVLLTFLYCFPPKIQKPQINDFSMKTRYEILDGLRGVAAVSVLVYHLFEAIFPVVTARWSPSSDVCLIPLYAVHYPLIYLYIHWPSSSAPSACSATMNPSAAGFRGRMANRVGVALK